MEGLINKMRDILRDPSLPSRGLVPETAKTSLGGRIQRAITGGSDRKFSGAHSPSGGATSPSLFLNRRVSLHIVMLLAALAVGLLFLLPGGLAHGQDGDISGSGAGCEETADETGYDCEYAENGEDAVATFTATDPEGAAVSWDLVTDGTSISGFTHGPDFALFSISKDGVLTFDDSPDYESGTNNEHMVTVRATDNMYDIDGVAGVATPKTVTVMVTNEESLGG